MKHIETILQETKKSNPSNKVYLLKNVFKLDNGEIRVMAVEIRESDFMND